MVASETNRIQKAILEVINNQLRDNNPPQTKKTLERLKREGFSEDKALNLIGSVVAVEVVNVLKKGLAYDEKRYIAALEELPNLPWKND